MSSASSYAFYFDVSNTTASAQTSYIQFITKYRDASGFAHVKCTTCLVPLIDSSTDAGLLGDCQHPSVTSGDPFDCPGLAQVAYEFDQEAAAVLVARLAIFKAESEFATDVLRWLGM